MKFYLGVYMCSAWGATVHSFSLIYRNGTNFMAREIAPKTVACERQLFVEKLSFWMGLSSKVDDIYRWGRYISSLILMSNVLCTHTSKLHYNHFYWIILKSKMWMHASLAKQKLVEWFSCTGWAKKVRPQTHGHNSVKSQPIY